ncbi:MAG: branched-chain amino acid ABC transporter permease [Pseudorhodoplanes sp.]
MSLFFFAVQLLNAVQYGLILFLVASGLTLLLGLMGVINLAHGVFYMAGAYLAYFVTQHVADIWLALPAAILIGLAIGAFLERFLLSRLDGADHLSQVLLSFGLILILNEAQRVLFGSDPHGVAIPRALDFSIPLSETLSYPAYRLFLCGVGLCFVVLTGFVMTRTRIGTMLRAGAENREMARALGIDVKAIYLGVTAAGIACAMLAGAIAAPLTSVYPGMGDRILILSFVVVVLGGMGSLSGALAGALLLGLVDTFGKQYLPDFAAFLVYAAMIAVLALRPQGLFGRKSA